MTRDYAAPDWRGLCEELLGALENEGHAHWPGGPDGDPLIEQARAALAQPEPEVVGPTDEELLELYPATMVDHQDAFTFARAVIARWGRPAPAPAGGLCELVNDLRDQASQGYCEFISRDDLRRAADLLEQLNVTAKKPESDAAALSDEELLELAQHHSVSYTMSDGTVVYPLQEGCDMRDDVLSFARAAIAADRARFGRPAPAPAGDCPACEGTPRPGNQPCAVCGRSAPAPAEGEVGELVAWLRMQGEAQKPGPNSLLSDRTKNERHAAGMKLTRAADLLEQRQVAPVPVAVSERLPEPGVKVLAHYLNGLGKGRTICAIWVPAKSRSDDLDSSDDDFTEYDEETDKFYWPEGWYEAIENWDDLGWVKVYEGEVIYWQPLPQWPAHALPLPSGEVE